MRPKLQTVVTPASVSSMGRPLAMGAASKTVARLTVGPNGQRPHVAMEDPWGQVAFEHNVDAAGPDQFDRGGGDLLVVVGRHHVIRGDRDARLRHGRGDAVLLADQDDAVDEPVIASGLHEPQVLDAVAARQHGGRRAQPPGDLDQIGHATEPIREGKLGRVHWLFSSFSSSAVQFFSTCCWCHARIPSLSAAARCLNRPWILNHSATGTTFFGL